MKNAARRYMAMMAACACVGFGMAMLSVETISPAAAANALPSEGGGNGSSVVPGQVAAPPILPVSTPSSSQQSGESATRVSALPPAVTETPKMPAPPPPAETAAKGPGNKVESDKVPESVRDIVKKLSTGTETATVEDLNEARQAVAKLDLLLDIEKRLMDLAKVRAERDEKAGGMSIASALPASALGLKNARTPVPMPSLAPPMTGSEISRIPPIPMMAGSGSVDVERIMGARGHYVALIKQGEGKSKQYKVGDKFLDGRIVHSITSQGVTLMRKGKAETYKVRDVVTVFGRKES